MSKLIFATTVAIFVSPAFVSAQQFGGYAGGARTVHGGEISTIVAPVESPGRTARPIMTSAYSRNIGPASSMIGYGQDGMGSSGSGNTQNSRAPSANGTGGGQ